MSNQAQLPELDAFSRLRAKLAEYGGNASANLTSSFSTLSLQNWIRIIIIVGGYMLMRPYLMKLAAKAAMSEMEKEDARSKAAAAADPEISPNDLRGLKQQLLEEQEQEASKTSASDWGQKARVRQRKIINDLLEEEEQRRMDREDDADIQEFLHD